LHPLVAATKAILEGKAKQPDRQAALDIGVSKGTRERALRLLSVLLCTFEERGFTVRAGARDKEGSVVVIKGEPIRFSLEEPSKKVSIPATKMIWPYAPNFELVPTGKLTFRIHEYWTEGLRKSWSDGVKHSLEGQINNIFPALVDISLVVREKRLKREQEWAVIAEQSR
jgi:hypothetical protein